MVVRLRVDAVDDEHTRADVLEKVNGVFDGIAVGAKEILTVLGRARHRDAVDVGDCRDQTVLVGRRCSACRELAVAEHSRVPTA